MFLDESLEKDLRMLAQQRGTPVASLVREALALYVASAQEAPKLSFVGAGASGRSDVAERHEELLWREPHADAARKPARRRTPAKR